MTCKCPKSWCYQRADCRKLPQQPVPPISRSHAAALVAIERAIDRLHHAEMKEPMRGLRLVQLYARRDELKGTET